MPEALAVARAVGLDALAHVGEALGAFREDSVEDAADRLLEGRQLLRAVAEGELQIRHVLVPEPAPDLALGRDRLRRVAAPSDQVEERGRELQRAGSLLLTQQRWHECGLGLGRRRLLVLAVVRRASLAPEEEPRGGHERERRAEADQREEEERAADVALGVVDAAPIAFVC